MRERRVLEVGFMGGKETTYVFVSVDQLLDDFLAEGARAQSHGARADTGRCRVWPSSPACAIRAHRRSDPRTQSVTLSYLETPNPHRADSPSGQGG
jgi:hypothetical protein